MTFSDEESSSDLGDETNVKASPGQDEKLIAHLKLLRSDVVNGEVSELETTPMFTEAVRKHADLLENGLKQRLFTQYGLLAGDLTGSQSRSFEDITTENDPRLFYNVTAPSSVFICGSQGSGKSHTLSCLLENCLIPSTANVLPRPLTGIVFHYDTFISDTGGSPCEAAFLSTDENVTRIYSGLPNVQVEELRINETDLNTKRMLELMAISSISGGMPLYLHVVTRILRDLRILQHQKNTSFDYGAFKRAIDGEALTDGQLAPLQQRLETLESFMVTKHARAFDLFGNHHGKGSSKSAGKKPKSSAHGNDWTPKAGQVTIVDLSCPCVTADMACSLFNICLSLFLEQGSSIGRVIALDEAHKYMTDSAECQTLTESLLSTIRLQRHLGARVVISTQEPTISPRLLDLCSITIVHRFTSPDWMLSLQRHLAGASVLSQPGQQNSGGGKHDSKLSQYTLSADPANLSTELFSRVVALRTGEALLFAPSAIIGIEQPVGLDDDNSIDGTSTSSSTSDCSSHAGYESAQAVVGKPIKLGHGVMKVRIRKRLTRDGGKSVLAA